MIYSHARLLKVFVSLILLVGFVSNIGAQSSLRDWICRLLGIDVRTYDRLSKARPGQYQPILGARLMRVKLPEEQETLIWKCDGCWSPVMVSETEAVVLKQDGIWLVPLAANSTAPTRPKVAAPNIVAIIGPIGNQSKQLIVAQRNVAQNNNAQQPQCAFTLRRADLNDGKVKELDDTAVKCLEGPNQLFLSINSGRLRNNKLVIALRNTSDTPRSLWKQTFDISQNSDKNDKTTQLLPKIDDNSDDGIDRYDPNWINDNEVIYIANP
jgi:hypothetical protein